MTTNYSANDNNRSVTSPHHPRPLATRTRRRLWLLLAIPLTAGAASLFLAGAHADAHPFGGGLRGGGKDPAAFMQKRMDRLLDAAAATDAQKTQIKAVWEPLRPQLMALHKQQRDLHGQIGDVVAAPTIDRARVEQVRLQSVQTMDKISTLVTQGMLASAQVLTPEQRKIVRQKMEERRGHHRGGDGKHDQDRDGDGAGNGGDRRRPGGGAEKN